MVSKIISLVGILNYSENSVYSGICQGLYVSRQICLSDRWSYLPRSFYHQLSPLLMAFWNYFRKKPDVRSLCELTRHKYKLNPVVFMMANIVLGTVTWSMNKCIDNWASYCPFKKLFIRLILHMKFLHTRILIILLKYSGSVIACE